VGLGGYVRYCDDFLLLDDDRGRLGAAVAACEEWLAGVRLRLHRERLAVLPSSSGRVFVGFRTWASHRLLKAANVRGFLRRLRWLKRQYARGEIGVEEVRARLMSWLGHAGRASTRRLVARLRRGWVFRRRCQAAAEPRD